MSCKEKITTDIYISLTTMDYKIDQKALHAIVTSAIDFINTKPEEYKKNNQNIKLAIDILEIYVKVQSKKLKEDKKNKTNDDSQLKKNHPSDDKTKSPSESKPLKTKSDINSENKQQQNERVKNLSKNIDYYMEAPYETKYSEKHTRKRNIFYALIWLAELNGVLCNNLEDNILDYETALNKYINEAYEFGEKYYVMNHINKNDTHLTYLKHKYQAKKLYTKSRWEMSTWPGGWVSSPSTSLVQINHCQILNALTLNDVSSRVNDYLNYIKNDI
ncbi:uncharacterized protein LOC111035924 isoform X2 [Myzus persicae]|uniref:uncharacterized protein LOC111035924 isoform X2 n=1 Tax=Myzus persicae TaxID=13164 RepID=UPI000B9301EF|nr:uncharacterized protein LOC111035924 isoform X2 [Myzus persicae]